MIVFAAIFIINIMCLISVSLIITIWILNLYYHSDDKPVPKWIKRLILEWIAAMPCVKCERPSTKVSSKNEMPDEKVIMGSVETIVVHDDIPSPEKPRKEIILPDYVSAFIQHSMEKEEAAAILDQNKSDWQSLARVMDRFFLIIFLVAMFIVSAMTYNDYQTNWSDWGKT